MISVHSTQESGFNVNATAAIMLYTCSEGIVRYATHHQINKARNRLAIGAGSPLSQAFLTKALTDLTQGKGADDPFIDAHILASNEKLVAWWTPPAMRRAWFKNVDLAKRLGQSDTVGPNPKAETSVLFPYPGLVFIAKQNELNIFAVEGNQRPTRESCLFKAPAMNVYVGGDLCTGNATMPQISNPDSISHWEDVFFRSRFTHFHDEDIFVDKECDALESLARVIDKGQCRSQQPGSMQHDGEKLNELNS
jgi:PRTRC genetic system protein B